MKKIKEVTMKENRFGLSGTVLKMIAVITMLIDHIGAVIVQRTQIFEQFSSGEWLWLNQSYGMLRDVGRLAFPIFCFLLVEGFVHTRNDKKYLVRMLLFALISEIPFNLALTGNLMDTRFQNVYWELSLGLIVLMLMKGSEKGRMPAVLSLIYKISVTAAGMLLAELLYFDYGLYGILSIAILYLFRSSRLSQALAGGISFSWELPAPLAFFAVVCYNGKRGRGRKYPFYIFYPAHLLILYGIARAIGCPY